MFFYKIPTDCKKFSYKFTIPKGVDVKSRILKVDTELGYTWVADPPPSIKYLKEGTEITWEKTNLEKRRCLQVWMVDYSLVKTITVNSSCKILWIG